MEDAGLEPAGFHGVPVFQATGLSIKTKDARRTPLFFNKSDLDAALGNAVSQKMTQREQVTQAKVDRARQDLADANKQVVAQSCVLWHPHAICAAASVVKGTSWQKKQPVQGIMVMQLCSHLMQQQSIKVSLLSYTGSNQVCSLSHRRYIVCAGIRSN